MHIDWKRVRRLNLVNISKQRISSRCVAGCHSLQGDMYWK